jgi:hypothetical protein
MRWQGRIHQPGLIFLGPLVPINPMLGHPETVVAKAIHERLADLKSRDAAVSRGAGVCYPFCRKHGKHWQ